jgi:PAS domain S-box-containing protein
VNPTALHAAGGDLADAITEIKVPSYLIDTAGVIRWLNPAAAELVGDVRGRQFTSVLAPEDVPRARQIFAQKVIGGKRATESQATLIDKDGRRIEVEVCGVSLLEGHHCVGVFGQLTDAPDPEAQLPPIASLTPRQLEVLHLLEHGLSTEQIAKRLVVSPETVRNHVRNILRTLGVHSRLEAVAVARRARAA